MTPKTLLSSLEKQQLVAVNPVGEPFDPQLHQAMTAVPNADCEPNTVLNVFQRATPCTAACWRPAMVVVSKNPSNSPAAARNHKNLRSWLKKAQAVPILMPKCNKTGPAKSQLFIACNARGT